MSALIRASDPGQSSTGDILVHGGFLNSAEALEPTVAARLNEYIQRHGSGRCHVAFTGHSAGGAVASLLYVRHLSRRTPAHLSCVTFGCPPITNASLPASLFWYPGAKGVCLNIVNEFDIVARADRSYILSLANLIRSIYGLRHLEDADAQLAGAVGADPVTANARRPSQNPTPEGTWPMLPAQYTHVGPLILLLTRVREDENGEQALRFRAVEISQAKLVSMLFCRVNVHRRQCYAERVKLLVDRALRG